MPQLDFFLSEVERQKFIQYCFKQRCNIIPDQHYESNKYIVVTTLDQYERNCKDKPLLFISSNDFTTYPLELDYFEDKGKKKYFIIQRHGGPTIDLFCPVIGELEENIVGPGFIGIYQFYYRDKNKYVPNKSLTGYYKLFTTYIKEICEKVKLGQRVFWIGKQTIDKAKKGEIQLLSISNIDVLKEVQKNM
jgi:hypothetical protein